MRLVSLIFAVFYFSFISYAEAMPSPLPNGSYKKTCHECRVHGNTLLCMCQNKRGSDEETLLRMTRGCSFVENINGQLQCTAEEEDDDEGSSPYPRPHRQFDIDVGPLWNQMDAQRECPLACYRNRGKWTGIWSSQRGSSICQCERKHSPHPHRRQEGLSIHFDSN
jgi:hypothetical protein